MRALEFIVEAAQKMMEPELYEEVPNSILKKAVQAALPGVQLRFRTTPEGYLNVTNDDDSVRLDIGMSIDDSELSFNIENAYLTKHAKGGAMTAIIANAFALAEKKYGIPRARSLSVYQDRSDGVWQHIANKLGLEYSAHIVGVGESTESIQESVHAYHGTFQPTLTRFNALSHFGTLRAAEDRLKEKARRGKIKVPGRVYEVVLDIKNPFIAKDFAGVHSPTHFVFDLKTKGLISQEELEAINRHIGTPRQAELLIKKLRELGFDSIAYKNKYEDKGSTSYVILDPTQVVSVRPLKQKTAITESRIPDEIEDFLYDLQPDDVGVEEFGPYRVHYEGFTDDCQSSSDYCADPEAVYQQVFADHIAREGGRRPIEQNFTGDEDYPILYSIFKVAPIKENFADKKVKGKSRPGRVKRAGASCKGSVSSLRAKAKRAGGERGKMYHWCANMKAGRAKNESELDEDWRSALAGVATAGAMALGGADDVEAKSTVKPATVAKAPAKSAKPVAPVHKPVSKQAQAKMTPIEKLKTAASANGIHGTELAQFLAQCAHESANFTRMEEIGSSKYFAKKYDPKYAPKTAKILGNTEVGDGERYKGRGFIQLTGRENYQRAGQALGLPLEANPNLAARPDVAAVVAVWYWKTRVANKVKNFANTRQATKAINPAMKGIDDRMDKFKQFQVAMR